MGTRARLLLIAGSLRAGSTNAAVLRLAGALAPEGVIVDTYDRLGQLPHFNPDQDVDPLPLEVVDLRERIDAADAILFCTPEYAGALPGSFKNLLDWTVGGIEIGGKAVAWINCSASPTGGVRAQDSLRTVLGYVDAAVIDAACVHVRVPRQAIDSRGEIDDPAIRQGVTASVAEILSAASIRASRQDPP